MSISNKLARFWLVAACVVAGQAVAMEIDERPVVMKKTKNDLKKEFFKALENGNEDNVSKLLNVRSALASEFKGKKSALEIVCEKNFEDIVRLLVFHGANLEDGSGEKALRWAYTNKNLKLAKFLIEKGAYYVEYLFQVFCKNNFDEASFLLDAGVDVNARNLESRTLLYWACKNKNPKLIELLIQKGADINAEVPNTSLLDVTKSLLDFVVDDWKDLTVFKLLVENGARFKRTRMSNFIAKYGANLAWLTPVLKKWGVNEVENLLEKEEQKGLLQHVYEQHGTAIRFGDKKALIPVLHKLGVPLKPKILKEVAENIDNTTMTYYMENKEGLFNEKNKNGKGDLVLNACNRASFLNYLVGFKSQLQGENVFKKAFLCAAIMAMAKQQVQDGGSLSNPLLLGDVNEVWDVVQKRSEEDCKTVLNLFLPTADMTVTTSVFTPWLFVSDLLQEIVLTKENPQEAELNVVLNKPGNYSRMVILRVLNNIEKIIEKKGFVFFKADEYGLIRALCADDSWVGKIIKKCGLTQETQEFFDTLLQDLKKMNKQSKKGNKGSRRFFEDIIFPDFKKEPKGGAGAGSGMFMIEN